MFFADDSINPIVEAPQFDIENSDPHGFYKIVDDYTQQDFALNYGGYPRSDIALLNEQQDMTYVNNLLSRLSERSSDGVSDDVSDFDLSLAHKSKYCQTASEMIKYYENLLEERDRRSLETADEKDREKLAVELAEKRKILRDSLTPEEIQQLNKLKRDKEIESLID